MKAPSADCRAVLARVSAYLDGDLPRPDCRAIERHCRTCDACAESLGALCRAVSICRKTARRQLPPVIRQRARQRIKALLSQTDGGRSAPTNRRS